MAVPSVFCCYDPLGLQALPARHQRGKQKRVFDEAFTALLTPAHQRGKQQRTLDTLIVVLPPTHQRGKPKRVRDGAFSAPLTPAPQRRPRPRRPALPFAPCPRTPGP